jgi:hypothetical protein
MKNLLHKLICNIKTAFYDWKYLFTNRPYTDFIPSKCEICGNTFNKLKVKG